MRARLGCPVVHTPSRRDCVRILHQLAHSTFSYALEARREWGVHTSLIGKDGSTLAARQLARRLPLVWWVSVCHRQTQTDLGGRGWVRTRTPQKILRALPLGDEVPSSHCARKAEEYGPKMETFCI